jgi:quercetin dioxygenase-like cupin family protein
MSKRQSIISHVAVGTIAAVAGALATATVMSGYPGLLAPSPARAQDTGTRQTEVMTQVLSDLKREMRVRVTERDPGSSSTPHRHPGHHTFGYVLEGTYEVQVDNGPVRQLKPGEAFYEPPGSLHAVSRNPSKTERVRYLIFQVADPTKPATVRD